MRGQVMGMVLVDKLKEFFDVFMQDLSLGSFVKISDELLVYIFSFLSKR
jgi:hypothetical protein